MPYSYLLTTILIVILIESSLSACRVHNCLECPSDAQKPNGKFTCTKCTTFYEIFTKTGSGTDSYQTCNFSSTWAIFFPIIALILALFLVAIFYFAMYKIFFQKSENLTNVHPTALITENQQTEVGKSDKKQSVILTQEIVKNSSFKKDFEKNQNKNQTPNRGGRERPEVIMDTLSPYRVYTNRTPQSNNSNRSIVREENLVPEKKIIVPIRVEKPSEVLQNPLAAPRFQSKVVLLPENLNQEKPNISQNPKKRLIPLPSFGHHDNHTYINKQPNTRYLSEPKNVRNENKLAFSFNSKKAQSPQSRPQTSSILDSRNPYYTSPSQMYIRRVQFNNDENVITSPVRNTTLPNDFQIRVVKKKPEDIGVKGRDKENYKPVPPTLKSPIHSDNGTETFVENHQYFASLENSKNGHKRFNTPKKELNQIPDLKISNQKTPVIKKNYRVIYDSPDDRMVESRHINKYIDVVDRAKPKKNIESGILKERKNGVAMEQEFDIEEGKSVKAEIENNKGRQRILKLD